MSLLKPVKKNQQLQPPPPCVPLNGEVGFAVDMILVHCRTPKGRRWNVTDFLIRWEIFDKPHDSWEPEALIHDPKVVQDYWDYVVSCEQHTNQQVEQTL